MCAHVDCEQEGSAVQTAQRAQLCGKWLLKLHHGRLSIIHRTHDCFSFLSPFSERVPELEENKKEKKSVLIWILTFAANLAHSHPVSFILCSVSSLSSRSAWFFFTSSCISSPFTLCGCQFPSFSIVRWLWCFLLMMSLDYTLSEEHKAIAVWSASGSTNVTQRQRNADCNRFKTTHSDLNNHYLNIRETTRKLVPASPRLSGQC